MKGLLLAALLLGGCAPAALEYQSQLNAAALQGDLAQQIQVIKEWKRADLAAAAARATAGGDRIGALCWTTLAKYVDFGGTLGTSAQFVGVFDAFEAGRLAIRGGMNLSSSPILEDLQIGCGPLVGDIRLTLGRLAIMGAGAIAR